LCVPAGTRGVRPTRRARAGTNAKRARGREEKDFAARPTRFHALLRRLLPAALRLAAAAKPVARGLFGELVPALVHWLTRSARTCARLHKHSYRCPPFAALPQRKAASRPPMMELQ